MGRHRRAGSPSLPRRRLPGPHRRLCHRGRRPPLSPGGGGLAGWRRPGAGSVRRSRGGRAAHRPRTRGSIVGRGRGQHSGERVRMSKVYLVGAGPGDPELITLKGRRLLERADSVLYDYLANPALLDLAPVQAERIYVGKKKSAHAFSQEEICAMMIEHARRGLNVVRLKGGDPFIFGRGGEEAEALAAAGVAFEVVPGVTSPLGIAAYTGV